MILSPGRAFFGSISAAGSTALMPDVLMNIPSPFPLSTTLVSPVTRLTPAASAAVFMERTIFQRRSIGRPSSIMNAEER